jgi:hypothetical protein
MRELRSSGSVGGEAGNLLAYPAASGITDKTTGGAPATSCVYQPPMGSLRLQVWAYSVRCRGAPS